MPESISPFILSLSALADRKLKKNYRNCSKCVTMCRLSDVGPVILGIITRSEANAPAYKFNTSTTTVEFRDPISCMSSSSSSYVYFYCAPITVQRRSQGVQWVHLHPPGRWKNFFPGVIYRKNVQVHPQDTKCTPSQRNSQFLGYFCWWAG